jgi:hypothetical protein
MGTGTSHKHCTVTKAATTHDNNDTKRHTVITPSSNLPWVATIAERLQWPLVLSSLLL